MKYRLTLAILLLPSVCPASHGNRVELHREFWTLRKEAFRVIHHIMRGDHITDRQRARMRYIRNRTDAIIEQERKGDF